MMSQITRFVAPIALLVALAGCGSDASTAELGLTPQGEDGRRIARSNGCASCHGSDGEGNVGPAFVGLYGAEVVLRDGSTVIADDAYLRESIVAPDAAKVAGYRLPMPTNDLDDDEIDAVIAYIRDLSGGTR